MQLEHTRAHMCRAEIPNPTRLRETIQRDTDRVMVDTVIMICRGSSPWFHSDELQIPHITTLHELREAQYILVHSSDSTAFPTAPCREESPSYSAHILATSRPSFLTSLSSLVHGPLIPPFEGCSSQNQGPSLAATVPNTLPSTIENPSSNAPFPRCPIIRRNSSILIVP
jgi:hypothetical protein